ncbi:MAG: hypothetical protein H5T69_05570 [Chloroflexi bacterium]|nr:hypothetical protein [Chloroflexota bacterium]
MAWWQVAILSIDLYILLSAGGWLLWRYLEWCLLRRGPFLEHEAEHLDALHRAQREQASFWPQEPRPGRYGDLDRQAHQALSRLSFVLAEANRLHLALGEHEFRPIGVLHVLLLLHGRPLLRAMRLLRGRRALRRQLALADQTLRQVHTLQENAEQIPFRLRAELAELGAETERLTALLEKERAAGTSGLDDYGPRLEAIGRRVEQALHSIEQGSVEQAKASSLHEADDVVREIVQELRTIDEALSVAADIRTRTRYQIERLRSSLSLISERWTSLKEQGVSQPELEERLHDLRSQVEGFDRRLERGTLDTYRELEQMVIALEAEQENLAKDLETLNAAMSQSRTAVEGDVQALARANAFCEALLREEPLLELDQSLALLERASQAYMQAEEQRGLGTLEGYRASLSKSKQAKEYLAQGVQMAEQVLEQVAQIREMLAGLSPDVLGEWRRRADRLNEELRIYARHWEAGLAGEVAEALSLLEQAEMDLERLSPNIRYQRRLRQSEFQEALETLRHAHDCLERAAEAIEALEAELERLEALRARAQLALQIILEEKLPALAKESKSMLAERQERFEALRARLQQEAQRLDPSQVHYDELLSDRLPAIARELQQIAADHAEDTERLRKAARDGAGRLSRAWNRLRKLNPYERPRPEEDPEALRLDLEEWRARIEAHRDDPATLQRLVGREVLALEQRLEAAYKQIVEGRRSLETLGKAYYRHAQRVRVLRAALEEIERNSPWPRLPCNAITDLGEAERVWNKALALERDSAAADTLVRANNELQQAVNAAQQAEQLYALAEHQVQSALRRLDDESRVATTALETARQRARALRQRAADGDPVEDRAELVEEMCNQAAQALQAAQEASTFEDALRHLREASNLLARVS